VDGGRRAKTLLSGDSSGNLVAVACGIIAFQVLVIAFLGHRGTGPFLSEFLQLSLGMICIRACLQAFRRSRSVARYAWRLLTITFILWAAAQALGVYEDLSGRVSLDTVDDMMFFFSVTPLGMLPFLDPVDEPTHFDRLHLLDLVQVCVFWVAILLSFSPRMWSAAAAFRIGPFTWSRDISLDLLLATTFVVRAWITKSKGVRSLFARMALFLLISGLADSYALAPNASVQPGAWFDLIWSVLLVIPIGIARTWKKFEPEPREVSTLSHGAANHFFALLYPVFSFFILIHVTRGYPLLGEAVFAVSLIAFAARMLIIQGRQRRSDEALRLDVEKRIVAEDALRRSELQYRLLFNASPIPMWLFDRNSLRFLAVNEAAIRHYGYSEREFLSMTIRDIRPKEDIPNLLQCTATRTSGLQTPSVWRHLRKDGVLIDVEIVAHDVDFHGIDAEVVAAHDVSERKRSEEMLRNSESNYRALFEDSADAMWLLDENGFVKSNAAALQMFGYSREEPMLHPADISPPYQEDGTPSFVAARQKMASAFAKGKARFEWQHKRKNGEIFPAEVFLTALTLSGQPRLLATVRDLTERKKALDVLLFKTALLEAQSETTIDGILVVDESDRIVLANKQFAVHFGISEVMLKSGNDLAVRKFVTDQVLNPVSFVERVEYLYSHREEKSRDEIKLKNGKTFDRYSAPLVDSENQYRGRIWYFRDITDRKGAEERVQYLAYYDSLTGLPNRVLFRDRLATALAQARRRNEKLALLFVDLDGFKHINDSLGHSWGDVLLKQVAERFVLWRREQDTVARLGGDEFMILLNNPKSVADVAVAAERLMHAMHSEFIVDGKPFGVTCSIGISIFPDHGMDAETLIADADAAMYKAKDRGRNNFQFFTSEMNAQAVERLTLETGLRVALDRGELSLAYQPQIDLGSGRITGVEALLRWERPASGQVSPAKIIPIAENSGLIIGIGEWVLRMACRQARQWQEQGLARISMAVNVSAVQFRQRDFVQLVERALRDSNLSPECLELELTESVLLSDAEMMLSVLQDLRAVGVKIAIDDFGTGYSSFGYLRQFRADKLKIDRSFVQDVAIKPDDAAIATAIISMGKSLNLKVIAEGVENDSQLQFLRERQCDEAQGYYFGKPVPADKLEAILRIDAAIPLRNIPGLMPSPASLAIRV
jgi:diguanylate cyclase (GGDEF)-like protein/PAS domain S-box-containing protein